MSLLLLLRTRTGGAPVVPGVFGNPQFTRGVSTVAGRFGDVPVSGVAARIGDGGMPTNEGNWS